jgi:hypothetical protein
MDQHDMDMAPNPLGDTAPSPGHVAVQDCDGQWYWKKGGTLKGHVLPGMLFMLWGSWWAFHILRFYVLRGGRNFRGRSFWPAPKIPVLEPLLRMVACSIGAAMEIWGDHDKYM